MKDRVDQLLANGVAAACLNSTQSREQQQEVMAGCRSGQIRLLYIAPERLMLDNFLDNLAHWNPVLLAVDEAHCISQWGMISARNMPRWVSCVSVSLRCRLWRSRPPPMTPPGWILCVCSGLTIPSFRSAALTVPISATC